MPYYSVSDLISSCKADDCDERVQISGQAEKDARDYFKLKTKTEIRSFIANGGLENLLFQSSKVWLLDPLPVAQKRGVDSYGFTTGSKYGYIAFIRLDLSPKWYIKSLKKNDRTPKSEVCIYESTDIMRLAVERFLAKGKDLWQS